MTGIVRIEVIAKYIELLHVHVIRCPLYEESGIQVYLT